MSQPHEIVKEVHEAYPDICKRLSQINGKSEEIYRSHHREPKTVNPLGSGNTSPTTHFIRECFKYEAAAPGAGRMLVSRVYAALDAEFTPCDLTETEIHKNLINEQSDVFCWLAEFDFDTANEMQLKHFEMQCRELLDAVNHALSKSAGMRRAPRDEAKRAAAVVNTVSKLNGKR